MARLWMKRKKHSKLTMDQCRMWRTEGILLESVKIGQYFRPVKYNNGKANEMTSDVSEGKTVLY